MAPFHRVLVPTDFSEPARYAIDYAVELIKLAPVPIDLFHVFVPQPLVVPEPATPGNANLLAELPHQLAAELERIGTDLTERGVEVGSVELVPGTAWEEIVRAADRRRCDLIVLGTHGRSGLERLLLGSVAEKVVRHAHCPVMAVRKTTKP
jgi:nucleotide-binding universal stress UspA family protein